MLGAVCWGAWLGACSCSPCWPASGTGCAAGCGAGAIWGCWPGFSGRGCVGCVEGWFEGPSGFCGVGCTCDGAGVGCPFGPGDGSVGFPAGGGGGWSGFPAGGGTGCFGGGEGSDGCGGGGDAAGLPLVATADALELDDVSSSTKILCLVG